MRIPATQSRVRGRIWLVIMGGVVAAMLAMALLRPRSPVQPLREVERKELVMGARGLHLSSQSEPFTGIMLERYPGGRVRSRSEINAGMLHGLCEGWYTNGVLQVREHFKRGVSDGLRTKWHPNGNKQSEGAIVAGQFNGLFQRWHENGALAERATMRAGTPDGIAESFYPSGSAKAKATVRLGNVISVQNWKDGEYKLAQQSVTDK